MRLLLRLGEKRWLRSFQPAKSWPSAPPTLPRSFSFIRFYFIHVSTLYIYLCGDIFSLSDFLQRGIGRPHGWLECVKCCHSVYLWVCDCDLYLCLRPSFFAFCSWWKWMAAWWSGKARTALLGRWRAVFPPSSVIRNITVYRHLWESLRIQRHPSFITIFLAKWLRGPRHPQWRSQNPTLSRKISTTIIY